MGIENIVLVVMGAIMAALWITSKAFDEIADEL